MLTNKEISNIQITWKTLSFPEIKIRLQELYHSDMSFLELVSALYWDLIATKHKNYRESVKFGNNRATLRICQLEETIKRYESENYKLTQELEQLGTDFNNQVSLVGWHEEQEEEYKRLLGKAMKALNDGSCNKDCRQCKWNNNGCEMSCRFAWKYGDEVSALIGETNDK